MIRKLFAASLLVVLAACGGDKTDEARFPALRDNSGILKYIPSNAPYAFVRLKPLPGELRAILDRQQAAITELRQQAMDEAFSDLPDDMAGMSEQERAVIDLAQDFAGKDLQVIGLDLDARFALYAVDGMPVMRVGVADMDALEAFIARVETIAGRAPETGEVAGQAYRYLEVDGYRLVLMTAADEFVASLTDTGLDDAGLQRVLGLELPGETIADTGRLADLAAQYGLIDFAIGYAEQAAIADLLLRPGGAVDRRLGTLVNDADASATCREEILTASGGLERVVVGLREISAERIDSTLIVDLRDELAAAIQGMNASVPGLGVDNGSVFSTGFSINIKILRAFIEKQMDAMAASPFECPPLQPLNAQVDKAREVLARQPTPPSLGDLRGAVAMFADPGSFPLGDVRLGEGDLLLATDNPESLTAMAELFLPGFAELGLEADGVVREIPQGPLNPAGALLSVLMASDRIVLATGPSSAARADALGRLEAPDASPLYEVFVDVDRLAGGILSELAPPTTDRNKRSAELLRRAAIDPYDELRIRLDVARQGLEVNSEITFNKEDN